MREGSKAVPSMETQEDIEILVDDGDQRGSEWVCEAPQAELQATPES